MLDEIVECSSCNGTGRDPTQWDDRCIYCDGKGDTVVHHTGPVDDELDDHGCADPECCP